MKNSIKPCSVVLSVDGYNRRYMTDTAELSSDLNDACVFDTPSETPKLREFQSYLEQQYPSRVSMQVIKNRRF